MIICEICTDIPKTAKDYCVNKLVVVVARTFFAENIFFVRKTEHCVDPLILQGAI